MNLDQPVAKKITHLVRALEPLQSELSLTQLLALCRIGLEPGLSVNDLADRLGCPQQTASRYVAALLGRYQGTGGPGTGGERGALDPLIVQEVSQEDPRRRALFLSEHGGALLKNIGSKLSI